MPGYIKEVPGNAQVAGTHMRMRMVQPGYNIDSAPSNKVIIDSDDAGTLSLIDAGVYRLNRNGVTPPTVKIASWSLSYIPLCTFQFKPYTSASWAPVAIAGSASIGSQRIIVDKTGITVTMETGLNWTDIAWQAYRLAAA